MNSNRFHVKFSAIRNIVVLIFATGTASLFFYLNKVQPNHYIDEIFHIPQTQRYCDGNFMEWDKKITTFPGLYLISFAILAPFNLCTTIYLRSINLMSTFLNFYVVYQIFKTHSRSDKTKNVKKQDNKTDESVKLVTLITSLNVAILPPLYFLLFLFYTDVLSTNMVLIAYLFYLKKKFKTSAIFAVLSVLVRQTNIVWVAWITLEKLLDIIENKNQKLFNKSMKNSSTYVKLLWKNVEEEINRGRLTKLILEISKSLFPYILLGLIFITFVIINKGIVLGDRSAHVATIHIPQLFYYSIFVCLFSWPYFITYLKDYLKLIKNRYVTSTLILSTMAIIIRYNTLVHPYLLADNRHYTFYVWNRIISRHYLNKYLLIPVYHFSLYSLWRGIDHLRLLSQVSYFLTISLVLIPQLLLEPRYFFVPYILFKINLHSNYKTWQILAESLTNIFINCFQFYVFSTKTFYWDDDVNPQRISW